MLASSSSSAPLPQSSKASLVPQTPTAITSISSPLHNVPRSHSSQRSFLTVCPAHSTQATAMLSSCGGGGGHPSSPQKHGRCEEQEGQDGFLGIAGASPPPPSSCSFLGSTGFPGTQMLSFSNDAAGEMGGYDVKQRLFLSCYFCSWSWMASSCKSPCLWGLVKHTRGPIYSPLFCFCNSSPKDVVSFFFSGISHPPFFSHTKKGGNRAWICAVSLNLACVGTRRPYAHWASSFASVP